MSDTPRILVDDDEILVIDKPSGWLVHRAGTDDPDVVQWLLAQRRGPVHPVHRLDKETSGVMVMAHTPEAARSLGELFAAHRVRKTYTALVVGKARQKGIIRRPLREGRHDVDAVTRWRCVERLGLFSLLAVRPETGRRHQVRRHLQGIGLPLVGDTRYGPRRPARVPAFPGRLFLHAGELALPDGRVFESPLPEELARTLAAVRAGAARDGTEDA